MSAEVSFDKELLDVEQFLLKNLPPDEHLLSMHDATSEIEEEGSPDVEHQLVLPVLPKGLSRSTIFQTPEAHPLVLNLLMLDAYGDDWLDWDMAVVEHAVEDKFGPILDVNVSKLMAVQVCYKSEGPWKNWEALVPVVMAFNNTLPDFETMQVPSPEELMIAVEMMNTLELRRDVWSVEVRAYMAAVFKYAQVAFCPEPCDFVTPTGFWGDLDREVVAKEVTRRIREKLDAPDPNTVEDVQVSKLLHLHEAQQVVIQRLREQLRLVRRLPWSTAWLFMRSWKGSRSTPNRPPTARPCWRVPVWGPSQALVASPRLVEKGRDGGRA